MDSKEEIANKDITKESKCDLPEKIASQIMKNNINDDCEKYKVYIPLD